MRSFSLSLIVCAILLSVSFTSVYALKPVREYAVIPDTLGLKFEKNTITTSDGFHIKSWTLLPADSINNKTTLILAHADAGNMSWFMMQAAFMVQNGYTVTLFDYRGFGESDSFAIDNKYLYYNDFVKDLQAVIKDDRTRFPTNKTGVWAFSMGTIITSLLPTSSMPDFIIGDSYVVDPKIAIAVAKEKGKDVILPAGADQYEKKVYKINVPLLVFAGNKDKITPPAEALKLVDKIGRKAKMTMYVGDHMQGFFVMSKTYQGSEYIAAVKEFTQKLK